MTNPIGSPADTLSALLAERSRYEAWLATLESRRAITPPHIYERVHADYVARLRYVNDQLAGYHTSVRDAVTGLSGRLAALDREEAGRRDELSEAELRASVGEISPEQAQEIIRRNREAIAGIASERAALGTELTRLREVLAMGPPGPAGLPGTGYPYGTPPPMPAGPPPGAPGLAGQPAQRGAGFNELEFLKSVVTPPGAATPPPAAGDTSHGALSGLPLVEHGSSLPGAGASSLARPGGEEARVAARSDTGEVPAFLKDVPPEQVKTLKCQECGTMNYPTEWYCERCGAELAAL